MSEKIGIPRFGEKTAAGDVSYQSVELGTEYELDHADQPSEDTEMWAVLSGRKCRVRWVKNNQSTALLPGQAVMRDTSGGSTAAVRDVKDVTGATVAVVGWVDPWLSSNVAEDEKFLIVVEGVTKVLGGDTAAAGVAIRNDATGEAFTCDLTTLAEAVKVCGVMLETNADGVLKWAEVNCRGF